MHDPLTVAHDIKWPFKNKHGFKDSIITIWHKDSEKDGTDDSCGWFIRPRHVDFSLCDSVRKEFELDWDKVFHFDDKEYLVGYFNPHTGQPVMSEMAITLNLFSVAAREIFRSRGYSIDKSHKKAEKYLSKNLFSILLFAENPVDSLHNKYIRKFEEGCGEPYTKEARDDRLYSISNIITTFILRDLRPWYRHPRWHIRHWRVQWHFYQKFKRWAFERCAVCHKGYSWGYSPVSNGKETCHRECDLSKKG